MCLWHSWWPVSAPIDLLLSFVAGFQPVSLLPPSLSDYTSHSQTLPTRGKHSKKRPPLSSMTQVSLDEGERRREGAAKGNGNRSSSANRSPSPLKPTSNHSPPNTKLAPQAIIDRMRPPSPSATLEVDGGGRVEPTRVTTSNPGLSRLAKSADSSPVSINQKQATPIRYGGKTPGEIVATSMRNRRSTGGGLKKAMTMYHENRKSSRKLSEEAGTGNSGLTVDGDQDFMKRFNNRLSQVEADTAGRASKSASESQNTYVACLVELGLKCLKRPLNSCNDRIAALHVVQLLLN